MLWQGPPLAYLGTSSQRLLRSHLQLLGTVAAHEAVREGYEGFIMARNIPIQIIKYIYKIKINTADLEKIKVDNKVA